MITDDDLYDHWVSTDTSPAEIAAADPVVLVRQIEELMTGYGWELPEGMSPSEAARRIIAVAQQAIA